MKRNNFEAKKKDSDFYGWRDFYDTENNFCGQILLSYARRLFIAAIADDRKWSQATSMNWKLFRRNIFIFSV